jgi:hypothetical protein
MGWVDTEYVVRAENGWTKNIQNGIDNNRPLWYSDARKLFYTNQT